MNKKSLLLCLSGLVEEDPWTFTSDWLAEQEAQKMKNYEDEWLFWCLAMHMDDCGIRCTENIQRTNRIKGPFPVWVQKWNVLPVEAQSWLYQAVLLGSTLFEVADIIALCEVCPSSQNINVYSKCNLKMWTCFELILSVLHRWTIFRSHHASPTAASFVDRNLLWKHERFCVTFYIFSREAFYLFYRPMPYVLNQNHRIQFTNGLYVNWPINWYDWMLI